MAAASGWQGVDRGGEDRGAPHKNEGLGVAVETPKLCIHCKHSKDQRYAIGAWECTKLYDLFLEEARPSLVDGSKTVFIEDALCEKARAHEIWCGSEGRWWEAKE